MITSGSRPFTAATSKLAYAQAFAGPTARRHDAPRSLAFRLLRALALPRRSRKL